MQWTKVFRASLTTILNFGIIAYSRYLITRVASKNYHLQLTLIHFFMQILPNEV